LKEQAKTFSSKQKRHYLVGKEMGTSETQEIWTNLNRDCVNSDEFLAVVAEEFDAIKRKTDVDYYSGYRQGLIEVLEVVTGHCRSKCSQIGKVSGEISASIFCEISKTIGRTASFTRLMRDAPNIICGNAYVMSCELTFIQEARNMCPSYATGHNFDSYYRASLGGACSYNPNKPDE